MCPRRGSPEPRAPDNLLAGHQTKALKGLRHLIYLDESGQSGNNLNGPSQPIFVLAALVVPEARWLPVEKELLAAVATFFPPPRPDRFEIHATALRNREGYFRQFSVTHRLGFRDLCLQIAQQRGLKLIYRAIAKKRFQNWVLATFGTGVLINPHVFAFPLVARVGDEYLKSLPSGPFGIFISDENREITGDIEKAIRLLRGAEGTLKLGQIIEKGFFINSATSLLTQLFDVCAYSARKSEEVQAGAALKPIDKRGVELIEPLIHRGNEAFQDTMDWMIALQKERSGQGSNPGR